MDSFMSKMRELFKIPSKCQILYILLQNGEVLTDIKYLERNDRLLLELSRLREKDVIKKLATESKNSL